MSEKLGRKPKFPPMVAAITEEEIVKSVNKEGIVKAAKHFGVSRITLWRWLNTQNYTLQYVKQEHQAS